MARTMVLRANRARRTSPERKHRIATRARFHKRRSGWEGDDALGIAPGAARHPMALANRNPQEGAIGIMIREQRRRQSIRRSPGAIGATSGSPERWADPRYFGNLSRANAGGEAGGRPPARNTISTTSPMAPS